MRVVNKRLRTHSNHVSKKMANYTVTEVMDMLMDDVDDSGEESEIEEDPSFTLPNNDSSSEDSDMDLTGEIQAVIH